MKKIYFILTIAFSLLTIVPNCTNAAKGSNMPIEIKTITQKGKKPYIDYQISRPSFHHFPDLTFQNQLNAYYKNATNRFKKE